MSDLIKQEAGEECSHENVIGCEYWYDHPARYDGVSEWQCRDCGKRVGRWSGRTLVDGDYEYRFGEKPEKGPQPFNED